MKDAASEAERIYGQQQRQIPCLRRRRRRRRRRERPSLLSSHRRTTRSLASITAAALFIVAVVASPPVVQAFVAPIERSSSYSSIQHRPQQHGIHPGQQSRLRRTTRAPYRDLDTPPTLEQEQEKQQVEEDNGDMKKRWLRWMMTGGKKPRGTNKVIMREPMQLGGLPRSDRYSSRDWFHNTVTMPNSAILRDIRSPVLAITAWATFLSVLHKRLLQKWGAQAAQTMYIPCAPHSLTMSALGLLLVFRTNSAYQRFAEGRKIWEQIVNAARDLFRMLMLYETEIGLDKRRRVQRLLAAFPYLLRHRIRPNLVMHRLDDEMHKRDPHNSILLYQDTGSTDLDPEAAAVAQRHETTGTSRRKTRALYWVDKRTLPWRLLPQDALQACARAQNRPLWVCDRMATEIRKVPDGPSFAARERLHIISHIDKLSRSVGGAERIHQTVVPLNYARHTLRALTLWLFSLPFCLVKDLGLLTGPVLFFVSWLLFGVYEIGVRIEDPFQGTLRLSIMCDTIRRDVLGDESIRSSAFQLESDKLVSTLDDDDIEGLIDEEEEEADGVSLAMFDEQEQEELTAGAGQRNIPDDINITQAYQ